MSSLIRILLLLVVISLLFGSFLSDSFESFSDRLDEDGTDTVRYDLWREYLNGIDTNLGNFLLGCVIDHNMPQLTYYAKNPHNSFLMLHSRFGLVGFLLVIIAVIKCFVVLAKTRNYGCLILLAVAFVVSFVVSRFVDGKEWLDKALTKV